MAMHGLGINRQILENQIAIMSALGVVLANTMIKRTLSQTDVVADNLVAHVKSTKAVLQDDDKEIREFKYRTYQCNNCGKMVSSSDFHSWHGLCSHCNDMNVIG